MNFIEVRNEKGNKMNNKILEELQQLLEDTKTAPTSGSDKDNAEYIIKKVKYFRSKGIPERFLYKLETRVAIHFTDYTVENFNRFFEALNYDLSSIYYSLEVLKKNMQFEQAEKLAKPLADYLELHKELYSNGQVCFQHPVERVVYRIEKMNNGERFNKNLISTDGNYTAFFLSYAEILNYLAVQPESGRNNYSASYYIECAEKISPCNPGVWMTKASIFKDDEDVYRCCMEKALKYTYFLNQPYGLIEIYEYLALHFAMKENFLLASACCNACIYFGGNPVSAKYVLTEENVDIEDTVNWRDILSQNKIQIGFGNLVIEACKMLKNSQEKNDELEYVDTVLKNAKDVADFDNTDNCVKKKKSILKNIFGKKSS